MPQIQVFDCPNCGSRLSYEAGDAASLTCQFCGSQVPVPPELIAQAARQGDVIASQPAQAPEAPSPGYSPPTYNPPPIVSSRPIRATKARRAAKAGGCVGSLVAVLVVACILGFVVAMVFGAPFRMSGSFKQALEAAQTNQAVVEAMGAPIKASWLPIGGSISCGGSSCSADYAIPIHGSRKTGRIQVTSNSSGGAWKLDATVYINNGGQPIELGSSASNMAIPTAAPTQSPADVDATQGAEARATKQAQATTDAQATSDFLAGTATAYTEATQQAIDEAATQAAFQATAQPMLTAQAPWKTVTLDTFKSNRLNWPVGTQQDAYILVTAQITGGKFQWTVTPKQDGSYANFIPTGIQPLTDFSAAVDINILGGSESGNYAYGLVFRSVNQDYGFFGIQKDGRYSILFVYGSGIYTDISMGSPAIHTQTGQTNHIEVHNSGSDFVYLINGQVVWVENEEMAPGQVGLGVDVASKQGEAQVELTNFEVKAP